MKPTLPAPVKLTVPECQFGSYPAGGEKVIVVGADFIPSGCREMIFLNPASGEHGREWEVKVSLGKPTEWGGEEPVQGVFPVVGLNIHELSVVYIVNELELSAFIDHESTNNHAFFQTDSIDMTDFYVTVLPVLVPAAGSS